MCQLGSAVSLPYGMLACLHVLSLLSDSKIRLPQQLSARIATVLALLHCPEKPACLSDLGVACRLATNPNHQAQFAILPLHRMKHYTPILAMLALAVWLGIATATNDLQVAAKVYNCKGE
jgi:hypothetical protein